MSSGSVVGASSIAGIEQCDADLARATIRRVSVRLLPFLFVLYIIRFLDRTNLSIAALQMNRDLRFSAAVYGLGAGVFALGYSLFEVPSNLILARVGARRWIARIMITWGVIAAAMMLVRTPTQFYGLRFMLGLAEAGFFPGVVYYLSEWFPGSHRARACSRFMVAIPVSAAIGGPLGGWILGLEGRLGLRGWQWLFLIEGIPAVLLGLVVLAYLTDSPDQAGWLSDEQRAWLADRLRRERDGPAMLIGEPLRALANPLVWFLALPYFLVLTAGYAFLFWAPIMIRDTLHSTYAATGLVIGAIGGVTALAMIVAGASSDRSGDRFLHAAAGAALMGAGFAGVVVLPAPWGSIAAFTIISIGQYTFLPVFWCVPSIVLRGTGAAAGIALVSGVGSLGGFVGPYAVGLFKNATGGTGGAFVALAVLAACAAGVLLLLRQQQAFAVHARSGGVRVAAADG